MTDALILLAPLLVMIIMVLFGFTGCAELASVDDWPDQPDETPSPTEEPYNKAIEATDGFLVLWPLNETTGAVAAATSGSATLINIDGEYKPGATPGSEGAFFHKEPGANFAPTLDGTTGYIEVPFNEQLNFAAMDPHRFSVELWVKPADAIPDGIEQILISSHNTSATENHRGYEIALVGTGAGHATVRGRLFHVNDGSKTVDVTPTQGDPLEWRHIVLTYDEATNELILYATVTGTAFDKAAAGSTLMVEYSPVQSGGGERPLRFGAGHLQAAGPDGFFAGRLDEVALYEVVLPAVTVEDHFKLF